MGVGIAYISINDKPVYHYILSFIVPVTYISYHSVKELHNKGVVETYLQKYLTKG